MKSNKLKTGELYVYNFALKRDDGKIEQDMIFRDKPFVLDELKVSAEKHHCEIICSLYGVCRPVKDSVSKENSFVVTLPKPVDLVDETIQKVEAVPMTGVNVDKDKIVTSDILFENKEKENNIENS